MFFLILEVIFPNMVGFFIKKAFFDGWDNLIAMVLFNIAHMIFLLLALGILYTFGANPRVGIPLLAILLMVYSVFDAAQASAVHGWASYRANSIQDFRSGLSRNYRHGILLGIVRIIMVFVCLIVLPFYFRAGGIFTIISMVLFWFSLSALLAMNYFMPLSLSLPGDRPMKTLKKCFIVLADNVGFSVFFGIYSIVCAVFSMITVGFLPGLCGMQLASMDAVRLLMFKYDYLEEHPDERGRRLPWEDLLWEEQEKVGPRSLKNMIFPWK